MEQICVKANLLLKAGFWELLYSLSQRTVKGDAVVKRDRRLCLRLSDTEREMIQQKMELCGCTNRSAYIRKMAMDGMVINVDIAEMKEISKLLGYNSKNIHQLEKNLNGQNSVYADNLNAITESQAEITDLIGKIYLKLAEL